MGAPANASDLGIKDGSIAQLSAVARREFLSWTCNHFLGSGFQALVADVRSIISDLASRLSRLLIISRIKSRANIFISWCVVLHSWTVRTKLSVSHRELCCLFQRIRRKMEAEVSSCGDSDTEKQGAQSSAWFTRYCVKELPSKWIGSSGMSSADALAVRAMIEETWDVVER